MNEDAPRSAADPRPNNEPYYIDSECECGEELVLYDSLSYAKKTASPALAQNNSDNDVIWHDEWVCPSCVDGVHLDWPKGKKERLNERFNNIDTDDLLTIEEVDKEIFDNE